MPRLLQVTLQKLSSYFEQSVTKVHEQVPKYRECITRIRFICNTSGEKAEQSYKKELWQT